MEQELILALGRVEGKLDSVLLAVDDHGKRLTILERWQAKVLGMAAVVGSLASLAWQYFTSGSHA